MGDHANIYLCITSNTNVFALLCFMEETSPLGHRSSSWNKWKKPKYSSIFLLSPSCVMLFTRIDPSPVALLRVASFFDCMIKHGSVSERAESRFLHVFTVLSEVRAMSAGGGAEVEGSPSRSGLEICVTAGITETADQSCVLPERRRAVWPRLLIMETHIIKDDNMLIKIVNGHMFLLDALKNICTYTPQNATCRCKSAF